MSMAERMSMFEGAKSNGGGGGGGDGARKSWRSAAPPMVKLSNDDEGDKNEGEKQSFRKTVPPNMYSQQQISSAGAPTTNGNKSTYSGISKLKTAVSGMTAAMETERSHRGLAPKPPGGGAFVGLVNQIAPKNPVGRAKSAPAKNSAASKKAALLHWCQRMVSDKENVSITNFSSSWNDGMAFCALFHHFVPNQIPFSTLDPKNREYNFRLAFTEGEKAGVTALLDVEDMVEMKNPCWMSVMTYVSLIYNHFNGIRVGGPRLPEMPSE